MGEYPENPRPLPVVEFCNKTGKKNPINGKGPPGNQCTGKMSYDEADREERVTGVQKMLMKMGYDIGLTESDGKFKPQRHHSMTTRLTFQKKTMLYTGTRGISALNLSGSMQP